MRIKLTTLVDITETGIRRGTDKVAVGQQNNYDTLVQVIGLRANPDDITVEKHEGTVPALGYKGKQAYWEFTFQVPDGSLTITDLQNDFALVPFVNELTETAKMKLSIFDKDNIVFEEI
jgi:hypothetical protein